MSGEPVMAASLVPARVDPSARPAFHAVDVAGAAIVPTVLSTGSATAIAEAFGLGGDVQLEGPVARGEQGQVWRLSTGRGDLAVKDPLYPVGPDEAEYDAELQDACVAAGIPMPAVVRTPGGRVVADVDGGPVRLYTWTDVLERDRLLDPAEVGALVARIHRVAVPAGGTVNEWYTRPVGEPAWSSLVERLSAARAPFADDLANLVPAVLEAERLIGPMAATQRCHLDLWADNVRRTPDGGLVVLDWEEAGPGDPVHELVLVLFDFCMDDPGRMATLHAAYVEAGGPARVRQPSDVGSLIAQTGNIGRVGCERWLRTDADDTEERARLESWIREFLDEPVTVEVAEQIVAAVRA